MVDVRMVIIVMIFVMDLMFDVRTNSKVGDGFGAEHDDRCDYDGEEDDKDDDHDDGDGWWWMVMDGDGWWWMVMDGDGWWCWCWWAGACYWLVSSDEYSIFNR